MKILLINGPNLNLLGSRETEKYGDLSLKELESKLRSIAEDQDCELHCFQSNSEEKIINEIHGASVENIGVIIINPAAFTHTSVALLDALRSINKPKIEIHLSNIYTREEYRKKSITSEGVDGLICGFGSLSYILAIEALSNLIYNK